MAYAFLVAPTPGPQPNSRYLGAFVYTALGTEPSTFTIVHSLNLTPRYLVTCSPQGAHDVPTIDPTPSGGLQALNSCQIAISGPLTAGDQFLFEFATIPSSP
jgi:hypothetical protein